MSETVHYTGRAITVAQGGKEANKFAKNIIDNSFLELYSYHKNYVDCLCDELYEEFFYHLKTETLYQITRKEIEGDMIRAVKVDDKCYTYDLKYYNGGAGFHECLNEAFDKVDNDE